MSKNRLFLSTFALLLATSALDARDHVPWVPDLATAQRLAASRNQLVMVHFTADWCGPCQRLKKNVYNQRTFGHAVAQDFVPVKVDVGVTPEIAQQFNVTAWPTDILITPAGNELHRMVSPQTDSEYLSILRQVSWRYKNNPTQQVAHSALPPRGNTPPNSSITAPVANYLKNRFSGGGNAAIFAWRQRQPTSTTRRSATPIPKQCYAKRCAGSKWRLPAGAGATHPEFGPTTRWASASDSVLAAATAASKRCDR